MEERTLLSVSLHFSDTQAIVGGTNINVSGEPNSHQSEMTLDVNPKNPLNLAGFSHNVANSKEIDVFYSRDGGVTWDTTTIDNGTNGTDDGLSADTRFDPAITFNADGNLYIAYGHDTGSVTTLTVALSTDGGETFSQFTPVDQKSNIGSLPGLDKWQLATGTDDDGDPNTNDEVVYIAYTQNVTEAGGTDQRIVVAGSDDTGATFTTPVIINDGSKSGTDKQNTFADPAVGPNGELYVSWHNDNTKDILFDVDMDGLFDTDNDFGTDVLARELKKSLFNETLPAQPQRGIQPLPAN